MNTLSENVDYYYVDTKVIPLFIRENYPEFLNSTTIKECNETIESHYKPPPQMNTTQFTITYHDMKNQYGYVRIRYPLWNGKILQLNKKKIRCNVVIQGKEYIRSIPVLKGKKKQHEKTKKTRKIKDKFLGKRKRKDKIIRKTKRRKMNFDDPFV